MTGGQELLTALDAAIYTTDAEGRITFYNPAAERLWGRKPDADDRWCGFTSICQADGQPMPLERWPIVVAVRERRSLRGPDAIGVRADGTRVPFLPFPRPLFDADGKVVGAINLLVDLAKSQEAEEQRARLAAIVASSDDAIVSKTLEGYITSWNAGAERIFGYLDHEMIGEHITKIIPPELHSEEVEILSRLSRGERIQHYETERVAKDGRRINISLTVSPVRDGAGVIIGASKVARDITERKRAEEVQRLLLNELNHRVKNTLATVDAIARQTLRRTANPGEFVTSFSGRIRSLARAHRLLTSNTFQGAPVSQLIRDQLVLGDKVDNRISWAGPDVTLEPQASLHMALVLHELGTNARKHGALSSPGGTVTIDWVVEGGDRKQLVLDWRETGGPKVTVRQPSGGFGTTLIEQSLKPHGGEVAMKFEEHGVSCHIVLPLLEQPQVLAGLGMQAGAAQRPIATDAAATQNPLEGKRVLLIEDEPLIAMMLVDYVTDAGCEVAAVAGNVEEALALVEKLTVDAALLDANLGGRSVEDIALALSRKGTSFAFVTGYGREALAAPFREAMMIEKPFSQDQLASALEQLVAHGAVNVVRLKKPN
jgi:PAS domain S-box-containing protein